MNNEEFKKQVLKNFSAATLSNKTLKAINMMILEEAAKQHKTKATKKKTTKK